MCQQIRQDTTRISKSADGDRRGKPAGNTKDCTYGLGDPYPERRLAETRRARRRSGRALRGNTCSFAALHDFTRGRRFAKVGCGFIADCLIDPPFGAASAIGDAMRSQEARYWEDKDAEAGESEEDESRSGSGSGPDSEEDDDDARARDGTSGSVSMWPQSYR